MNELAFPNKKPHAQGTPQGVPTQGTNKAETRDLKSNFEGKLRDAQQRDQSGKANGKHRKPLHDDEKTPLDSGSAEAKSALHRNSGKPDFGDSTGSPSVLEQAHLDRMAAAIAEAVETGAHTVVTVEFGAELPINNAIVSREANGLISLNIMADAKSVPQHILPVLRQNLVERLDRRRIAFKDIRMTSSSDEDEKSEIFTPMIK